MTGRVVQVSVSPGGVPKRAVPRAAVGPLGLQGDRVAHARIHGGPDRAVCLFSQERLDALAREGHDVRPGALGENLTVAGLDWGRVAPGARLRVGAAVVLEVTQYTTPCATIAPCFRDGDGARVHQDRHPGWSRVYARVLAPGDVAPGDAVALVEAEERR